MSGFSTRMQGFLRDDIARLEPYDPNFTPCAINLSANENTYGLPSELRAALTQALAAVQPNRYPDSTSNDLRDELARVHGLKREQVCVGNGGDELLFNLFLAFGGPERVLLDCPPSFSVYGIYSSMVGTKLSQVWRDPVSYNIDEARVLAQAKDAQIVVVTSPNNPTGQLASLDFIEALCKACTGIVVIDEAYIEFAGDGASAEPLLASCDNLVVLHTFSKAFCLAGARVGYVLAAPDIIEVLAAVRQPYSVNVFSQAAALCVLQQREAFSATIARICSERERVRKALSALPGVTVWPSRGNFLLVCMAGATRIRKALRDCYDILVRDFSSSAGLEDCLRITIGTQTENDCVIAALEALTKETL